MANTTITISELPPIGNAFTASTILPVVQTTGVVSTDSASLGNLGNYILTQAGANLQPAYVANFAYAVTNAAQPLITSVGNLTNLTMAGVANLGPVSNVTITGGYNGQFLQTNGNGNLNWALPASGNVTNYPAGANAQIQFNQSGNFGASTSLIWDAGNYSLRTTNMNATGNISAGYFIGDGGGLSNLVANTDNIKFSNTVISTANTLESITLQTYDNANSKTYSWLFDSQGDFTLPSNSTVYISGSSTTFFSGNDTDLGISVNSYDWTFDAGTGTLFAPGDISLGNVTGTPTDGSILSASNIKIITNNYGNTWKFDIHGNLTLPGNTFAINYANGMQVPLSNGGTANKIYNGNSNVTIPNANGNVIVNAEINEWIFDASTGGLHIPSGATITYNGLYDFQINVGNGAPNVYSWNFDAGGNLVLPGNTFSVNYANGQQVSLGSGTYGNSNVAAFLENYGSNTITTTGNVTTGLLTVPASDNGSIVFSDNGTDNNGSLKVDGGLNMTLSANSNFYVKQAGQDRLAITDGNTDLMASTNVVIHSNKAGTENKWIFDSSGNLSLPGSANYQVPGLGGNGHFDINSWYPVNISTGDGVNDAVSTWNFGYNGVLTLPNNFATIFADTGANQLNIGAGGDGGGYVTINATTDTGIGGSQNVFIQSNFSGNGYIWKFDDTGNTTLPTGAAIANISGFGPGLSTFFGDANGATFGTGPGNDITFTPADGAAIYSNGFMWTFSTDGNLTTPGNITGANVIEANTFLGTGNLKLQPDPNNNGAYLDVYLTSGPDVHIAGNGETVIVGSDAGANVSVQASGNVAIQANAVFGGTPRTWMFDYNGNLTLPQRTTINDMSGTGTTLTVGVPPTVIVISGADFSAVNTTYTRDFGQATPTWYPAGYTPGVNPYIMFTGGQYGIYNPGFVPPLYINTGTLNIPLIQWNLNPPLGSIAPTAVYTYGSTGPAWKFDPTGNLKLPGVLVAQASDNGSIIFSNNGTDTNGSFKVDGGLNMTINANSNFYVKQNGSDRFGITNTNTDLMAASNVIIHANKAGSEQNWIFDTTGLLTIPGDIDMFGGVINFHQEVGNITWGSSYMAFSQYGRINTNVDFFANSNVIGAQYLKGDGSNITNVPISWTTAPVSNTSSGVQGQVAYDSGGNLFICVATNIWSKITGTISW